MTPFILYLTLMALAAILSGIASATSGKSVLDRETIAVDVVFIFVLPPVGIGFSLLFISFNITKRLMSKKTPGEPGTTDNSQTREVTNA